MEGSALLPPQTNSGVNVIDEYVSISARGFGGVVIRDLDTSTASALMRESAADEYVGSSTQVTEVHRYDYELLVDSLVHIRVEAAFESAAKRLSCLSSVTEFKAWMTAQDVGTLKEGAAQAKELASLTTDFLHLLHHRTADQLGVVGTLFLSMITGMASGGYAAPIACVVMSMLLLARLYTVGKRFAKFAVDLHRNIQLTAAERGASVVSRSIVEGAVGTFDTALLKGRLVQFVQTIDSSGTQSRRLSKTTAVAVVFSSATSSSYTSPLAYANLLYKHPRIFLVFVLLGLGGVLFAPSIRAQ